MIKVNIVADNGQIVNLYNQQGHFDIPQGYEPKGIHLDNAYLERFAPPHKNIFIETGTYKGETVKQIYDYGYKFVRSCDLSLQNLELTDDVVEAMTGCKLVIGESPDCIPVFLAESRKEFPDAKDQEAVFWLDAHASGEIPGGVYGGCPLVFELKKILEDDCRTHTIFIDDRRLFGSAEWSYVTEESVMEVLREINPHYKITYLDGHIPNDVIVASVYDRG